MNFEEDSCTTYNPIYNYTSIHPEKNVSEYTTQISYNEFEFIDNSGNKKVGFKKFISLVDFVKFLIGKYKSEQINVLPSEEIEDNGKLYRKCIQSHNNYAYVDAFYYNLTNQLKKKGFLHGIDVYDNYLCIKKNVEINIADDFEYVIDSNYFNEKLNKLFHFKDESIMSMFKNDNIKLKELDISDVEESIDILNIEELEDLQTQEIKETKENEQNKIIEPTYDSENNQCVYDLEKSESFEQKEINKNDENDVNDEIEEIMVEEMKDKEQDTDEEEDIEEDDSDSEISVTDEEDEDNEDDEGDENDSDGYETIDDDEDSSKTNNETGSESGSESDSNNSDSFDGSVEDELNELILVIKEMPTQVVFIEKCDNTFDSLLSNNITIEELESAMFQIIVILYTYQKIFEFTHNDLHTNNIMYIQTDEPFLYYKIMDKTYKIPTFGKIYKIIDFGRAIYTVNDKLICSDSFSVNGTAHTQYNFEPFYNENKPIIKPNYSFDLCRLACSMLDFIIDDLNDLDKFKTIPIYNLIISWIYDDSGTNILYKRNGEERYPDFKLYRMIARIVHNHLPETQFSHECFQKYIVEQLENNNEIQESMMNIDELIKMETTNLKIEELSKL